MICRTLALPDHPEPAIAAALSEGLDQTYRAVIQCLRDNPAVRFEEVGGKQGLVLSHRDKHEPASLIALRHAVDARLPAVDLPEILPEIAAHTGFAAAFTRIRRRASCPSDSELWATSRVPRAAEVRTPLIVDEFVPDPGH